MKRVNESSAVGDETLVSTAEISRSTFLASGNVARWGVASQPPITHSKGPRRLRCLLDILLGNVRATVWKRGSLRVGGRKGGNLGEGPRATSAIALPQCLWLQTHYFEVQANGLDQPHQRLRCCARSDDAAAAVEALLVAREL